MCITCGGSTRHAKCGDIPLEKLKTWQCDVCRVVDVSKVLVIPPVVPKNTRTASLPLAGDSGLSPASSSNFQQETTPVIFGSGEVVDAEPLVGTSETVKQEFLSEASHIVEEIATDTTKPEAFTTPLAPLDKIEVIDVKDDSTSTPRRHITDYFKRNTSMENGLGEISTPTAPKRTRKSITKTRRTSQKSKSILGEKREDSQT